MCCLLSIILIYLGYCLLFAPYIGGCFTAATPEMRFIMYTKDEVLQFVEEEDVKFIRLAFCDVFGNQKNIAIMSGELERAFTSGISFDASAIRGFTDVEKSDLLLFPDTSTLAVLPWRPSNGKVMRMYCDIKYPDGTSYEADTRSFLKKAVSDAKDMGIVCNFGPEFEFYLFNTDERGEPLPEPYDRAGYFDIAPADKGENFRREVCLTLEKMGIRPETSHHEEGPGQNEIDFKYGDALSAADNAVTFKWVVKTAAASNGLYADFSPKPFSAEAGSGMHINVSVHTLRNDKDPTREFMAGIMEHIPDITRFLNPISASYDRLGGCKAPKYVSWSEQNRSQLIRIPAASGEYRRLELRSPDCEANPYLAFALLIYAGLDGIKRQLTPSAPLDINLYDAPEGITSGLLLLPQSLSEAAKRAASSAFVASVLPEAIRKIYIAEE